MPHEHPSKRVASMGTTSIHMIRAVGEIRLVKVCGARGGMAQNLAMMEAHDASSASTHEATIDASRASKQASSIYGHHLHAFNASRGRDSAHKSSHGPTARSYSRTPG